MRRLASRRVPLRRSRSVPDCHSWKRATTSKRRLLRQFPQTTESAAHSGFAIAVGLRQRFHHLLESAGGGRQLLANIVQVLSRLGPVVAQQRPQRGAGFAQRLGGGG